MKTNRQFSPRHEAQTERNLVAAMLTQRTPEELRAFLKDLCTPAELQAMADRWAVVEYLQQQLPYREIHRITGVSVTTIGRVARSRSLRSRRPEAPITIGREIYKRGPRGDILAKIGAIDGVKRIVRRVVMIEIVRAVLAEVDNRHAKLLHRGHIGAAIGLVRTGQHTQRRKRALERARVRQS